MHLYFKSAKNMNIKFEKKHGHLKCLLCKLVNFKENIQPKSVFLCCFAR